MPVVFRVIGSLSGLCSSDVTMFQHNDIIRKYRYTAILCLLQLIHNTHEIMCLDNYSMYNVHCTYCHWHYAKKVHPNGSKYANIVTLQVDSMSNPYFHFFLYFTVYIVFLVIPVIRIPRRNS